MKSNNSLLVIVFLLIAVSLGLGVFVLLRDPGTTSDTLDPGGGGRTVTQPEERDPDGTRRTPRAGTDDRTPRERINTYVRGLLLDTEGNPVPDAQVTLATPTRIVRGETADESRAETGRLLYTLFELVEEEEPSGYRRFETMLRSDEVLERRPGRELADARSEADGRFELALPVGFGNGPFVVRAVKEGVGTAAAESVQPGDELELTLGDRQPFGGVVTSEESGVPVPGTRVVIDTDEGPLDAVTDDAGRFQITGVVPGRYRIRAYAEGHTPLLLENQALAPGQELTLALPRGTRLEVKVVRPDLQTDEDYPLPEATVYLVNEEDMTFHEAVTDTVGVAVFENLLPGDYLVNAVHPEYLDEGEDLVRISGKQIRQEFEVYLIEAVETPITVVDQDGRPIGGAVFFTSSWDEEYDVTHSIQLPGTTDDQGQYTYPFTFDGPRAVLHVTKPGFAMAPLYPDDNESGDPLRVVLTPAYRVHGRITDYDGNPLPDAWIELEMTPDDDSYDDDIFISLRADADGRYDFPHLPAGELWIWVGLEMDEDGSEEIQLGPDNPDHEENFELEPDDEF